jgi:hypothetical protein
MFDILTSLRHSGTSCFAGGKVPSLSSRNPTYPNMSTCAIIRLAPSRSLLMQSHRNHLQNLHKLCWVGADLFRVCADSRSYFTSFGGLAFSSFLGTLISLRHCSTREVCNFFIWAEKSETRGKKYNIVAKAFFSWVSFLKKIFQDSDEFSGEPELCW